MRRTLGFRIATVGLLVVASDLLFHDAPVGISLALFQAALVAAVSLDPRARVRGAGSVVLAANLGLTAALLEEPTALAVVLAAVGLPALALTVRQGWDVAPRAWVLRTLDLAARVPLRAAADAALLHRRRRHLGKRSAAVAQAGSWAMPAGITFVFLGLLCAANPVLSGAVEAAAQGLGRFLGDVDLLRVLAWTLVAGGVWGLQRARARALPPAPPPAEPRAPGSRFLVRSLLLLNGLFLAQNLLDTRFLLLGEALPEGTTYAEYAHRGAYALLATALLAAGLVLLAFRPGASGPAMRWPRRLVLLFLAQNVVLTAFAADRLALYVEAYSLTRLRLAAGVWMAAVALGLLLVLWRILSGRTNRWLVQANALVVLVLLYGLALAPTDRWIADYDAAHCREVAGAGPAVDLEYLDSLGTEAIPALRRLAVESSDPAVAREAARRAEDQRARLAASLADWRGWTLRRDRLAAVR